MATVTREPEETVEGVLQELADDLRSGRGLYPLGSLMERRNEWRIKAVDVALKAIRAAALVPPATVTREQLQSIEWNGWNRDEADSCPACGRSREESHNDVCFIAAALASAPPAAPPEDAGAWLSKLRALLTDRRTMPVREEWISGQRFAYVKLDDVLGHIDGVRLTAASAAPPDPPAVGSPFPLVHRPSCGAWCLDEPCTCGLDWRIRLVTEQEMHAAWRKRAEEAELREAARQSDPPGLREAVGRALPALVANRPPDGQAAYSQVREAIDILRAAYDLSAPASPPVDVVALLDELSGLISMHLSHFIAPARENTRGEDIECVEYWPLREWVTEQQRKVAPPPPPVEDDPRCRCNFQYFRRIGRLHLWSFKGHAPFCPLSAPASPAPMPTKGDAS